MNDRLLPGVVLPVLLLVACGQPAAPSTPPPVDTPVPPPTDIPTPVPTSTPVPTPTITPVPTIVPGLSEIARDYPRVDGSTSTLPLQRVIACYILGVPCAWGEWEFFGTERSIAPDPEADVPPDLAERIYNMWHNGTHGSYVNLIENNTDLILVARSPSQDELDAARDRGVTLDARPVALDAFVFLLHVDNLVDNLDLGAVRGIYIGEITAWADVGGAVQQSAAGGREIHPYQRNPNSGSQELMEKLVMQGAPMVEAPDMILETMMGPVNVIGGGPFEEDTGDPLGIGYSVYYYAVFIFPHERVKLIGIDGVMPTSENIASRAYPLTAEVYVVVREGMPRDSTAVMLRDWLFTEEGQATIAESGYVPIR